MKEREGKEEGSGGEGEGRKKGKEEGSDGRERS